MAFFLLGRVDDTLSLLCPDTFSSRQDALAALSRVTAEPEFDLWDAEVLLLDTDAGTPVLLVRPAAAEVPVVEAEEEPEAIVVDDLAEEPLETVVVDEVDDADVVSLAEEDEPIVVAEDEPIVEVVAESPVETEAEAEMEPADEVAESAPVDEESVEAEADLADEVDEEQDAAGALRDALSRTAAQMEAEGIVAPESIGAPEPEAADSGTAAAPDREWPWDVAVEPEPAISPDIAFVLGELEEPSLDDGSILRGTIDDDTFAVARPLIMGAYAEPREDIAAEVQPDDDLPAEPMSVTELESPAMPVAGATGFAVPVVGDANDIITLEPLEDEASALDADVLAQPAVDSTDSTDQDISDFILDLGSVPHAEPIAEEPQPEPEPIAEEPQAAEEPQPDPVAETPQVFDDMPGVVENTCDDCIYEDTCPNRDQRLPKDCGSFSWR